MGYGKELKITKTYRNAQEVIDIAGNFIQKNESQLRNRLFLLNGYKNRLLSKPIAKNSIKINLRVKAVNIFI